LLTYFAIVLVDRSNARVFGGVVLNWFRRTLERIGLIRRAPSNAELDPDLKYVNVRRYLAYLERSIEVRTQWAVFEPNNDLLWASVRREIENFLYQEWTSGELVGAKPESAFFVKCDRSTMTQNDLDNGRLVALIGVATLRPAEFVIFRIGQWTRDRKDP
jgi:phage tail sheath protein FI